MATFVYSAAWTGKQDQETVIVDDVTYTMGIDAFRTLAEATAAQAAAIAAAQEAGTELPEITIRSLEAYVSNSAEWAAAQDGDTVHTVLADGSTVDATLGTNAFYLDDAITETNTEAVINTNFGNISTAIRNAGLHMYVTGGTFTKDNDSTNQGGNQIAANSVLILGGTTGAVQFADVTANNASGQPETNIVILSGATIYQVPGSTATSVRYAGRGSSPNGTANLYVGEGAYVATIQAGNNGNYGHNVIVVDGAKFGTLNGSGSSATLHDVNITVRNASGTSVYAIYSSGDCGGNLAKSGTATVTLVNTTLSGTLGLAARSGTTKTNAKSADFYLTDSKTKEIFATSNPITLDAMSIHMAGSTITSDLNGNMVTLNDRLYGGKTVITAGSMGETPLAEEIELEGCTVINGTRTYNEETGKYEVTDATIIGSDGSTTTNASAIIEDGFQEEKVLYVTPGVKNNKSYVKNLTGMDRVVIDANATLTVASSLTSTTNFTIDVSNYQASDASAKLVFTGPSGWTGNNATFTIVGDENNDYRLVKSDNTLSVQYKDIYVNSAWASLEDGTEITINACDPTMPSQIYTIGKDAFASYADALDSEAAKMGRAIQSFQLYIDTTKDIGEELVIDGVTYHIGDGIAFNSITKARTKYHALQDLWDQCDENGYICFYNGSVSVYGGTTGSIAVSEEIPYRLGENASVNISVSSCDGIIDLTLDGASISSVNCANGGSVKDATITLNHASVSGNLYVTNSSGSAGGVFKGNATITLNDQSYANTIAIARRDAPDNPIWNGKEYYVILNDSKAVNIYTGWAPNTLATLDTYEVTLANSSVTSVIDGSQVHLNVHGGTITFESGTNYTDGTEIAPGTVLETEVIKEIKGTRKVSYDEDGNKVLTLTGSTIRIGDVTYTGVNATITGGTTNRRTIFIKASEQGNKSKIKTIQDMDLVVIDANAFLEITNSLDAALAINTNAGLSDLNRHTVLQMPTTSWSASAQFIGDYSQFYAATKSGKYLYVQKLPIYVSASWSDLAPESVITVNGQTYTIGKTAFATLQDAEAAAEAIGDWPIVDADHLYVDTTKTAGEDVLELNGSTVLHGVVHLYTDNGDNSNSYVAFNSFSAASTRATNLGVQSEIEFLGGEVGALTASNNISKFTLNPGVTATNIIGASNATISHDLTIHVKGAAYSAIHGTAQGNITGDLNILVEDVLGAASDKRTGDGAIYIGYGGEGNNGLYNFTGNANVTVKNSTVSRLDTSYRNTGASWSNNRALNVGSITYTMEDSTAKRIATDNTYLAEESFVVNLNGSTVTDTLKAAGYTALYHGTVTLDNATTVTAMDITGITTGDAIAEPVTLTGDWRILTSTDGSITYLKDGTVLFSTNSGTVTTGILLSNGTDTYVLASGTITGAEYQRKTLNVGVSTVTGNAVSYAGAIQSFQRINVLDNATLQAGGMTFLDDQIITVGTGATLKLTGSNHTAENGLIQLGENAVWNNEGNFNNYGTVSLQNGASFQITGIWANHNLLSGTGNINITVGDGKALTNSNSNIEIDGDLSVTGAFTNIGTAIIHQNLTVSQNLDTRSVLTVGNDLTVQGDFINSGNAVIGGDVIVSGNMLGDGDYTIKGTLTVTGTLSGTGTITLDVSQVDMQGQDRVKLADASNELSLKNFVLTGNTVSNYGLTLSSDGDIYYGEKDAFVSYGFTDTPTGTVLVNGEETKLGEYAFATKEAAEQAQKKYIRTADIYYVTEAVAAGKTAGDIIEVSSPAGTFDGIYGKNVFSNMELAQNAALANAQGTPDAWLHADGVVYIAENTATRYMSRGINTYYTNSTIQGADLLGMNSTNVLEGGKVNIIVGKGCNIDSYAVSRGDFNGVAYLTVKDNAYIGSIRGGCTSANFTGGATYILVDHASYGTIAGMGSSTQTGEVFITLDHATGGDVFGGVGDKTGFFIGNTHITLIDSQCGEIYTGNKVVGSSRWDTQGGTTTLDILNSTAGTVVLGQAATVTNAGTHVVHIENSTIKQLIGNVAASGDITIDFNHSSISDMSLCAADRGIETTGNVKISVGDNSYVKNSVRGVSSGASGSIDIRIAEGSRIGNLEGAVVQSVNDSIAVNGDIRLTLDHATVSGLNAASGANTTVNGDITVTLNSGTVNGIMRLLDGGATQQEGKTVSVSISGDTFISQIAENQVANYQVMEGANFVFNGPRITVDTTFVNNGYVTVGRNAFNDITGNDVMFTPAKGTDYQILNTTLWTKYSGTGRFYVAGNYAVLTSGDVTYAIALQDNIQVNTSWNSMALFQDIYGDGTYLYGVNAFSSLEYANGLLAENGTASVTLQGDSLNLNEAHKFSGDAGSETTITTTDNLYANGNDLSLNSLTWNGIIYGGSTNAATGNTSVQVQNCTLNSGIYGGSRINGGGVSTGDISLKLSSVTMAAGKVISGAGYVLSNSDVTISNVNVTLENIRQSGTKAASFYAAGAIKGGNAHVNVTGAVNTEITDGHFVNVFNGINLNSGTESSCSYTAGSSSLTVSGGTYTGMVGNGSAVKAGSETRLQGIARLVLNGGVYKNLVYAGLFSAGGSAVIGTAPAKGGTPANETSGTEMVITGGTFNWAIYAGNGASTMENGANTTIYGDTNLLIDASTNTIRLDKTVYGGSMGTGRVNGNTTITFTGLGENLIFDANAYVTGDSEKATKLGDLEYVDAEGAFLHQDRDLDASKHFVSGTRTLVFDEFTGSFGANTYGSIDVLRVLDSNVEMAGKATHRNDLSNVAEWEFDLTGSDQEKAVFVFNQSNTQGDYLNDFAHDSLSITFKEETLEGEGSTWTVFDGSANTVEGFESFGSVTLNGVNAAFTENCYTAGDYKLYLEGDDLKLAKIATAV